MAEIRWTEEALCWLSKIREYIAEDNQSAAQKTVQGIYDRTQILSRFIRIGHRYESIIDREIRILYYGHYRIAYLIVSEETIDILGIFHGAMNIENYLE